jgi:hypothetical protein
VVLCRFGGKYADDEEDESKVLFRYVGHTAFTAEGAMELKMNMLDMMKRYASVFAEDEFRLELGFAPDPTPRSENQGDSLPDRILSEEAAVREGLMEISKMHHVTALEGPHRQLMEMGFAAPAAAVALQLGNNDVDRALGCLNKMRRVIQTSEVLINGNGASPLPSPVPSAVGPTLVSPLPVGKGPPPSSATRASPTRASLFFGYGTHTSGAPAGDGSPAPMSLVESAGRGGDFSSPSSRPPSSSPSMGAFGAIADMGAGLLNSFMKRSPEPQRQLSGSGGATPGGGGKWSPEGGVRWEPGDSRPRSSKKVCDECKDNDPCKRQHLVPCSSCSREFHTTCVGLKQVPFKYDDVNRLAFIRKNYADWRCAQCVRQGEEGGREEGGAIGVGAGEAPFKTPPSGRASGTPKALTPGKSPGRDGKTNISFHGVHRHVAMSPQPGLEPLRSPTSSTGTPTSSSLKTSLSTPDMQRTAQLAEDEAKAGDQPQTPLRAPSPPLLVGGEAGGSGGADGVTGENWQDMEIAEMLKTLKSQGIFTPQQLKAVLQQGTPVKPANGPGLASSASASAASPPPWEAPAPAQAPSPLPPSGSPRSSSKPVPLGGVALGGAHQAALMAAIAGKGSPPQEATEGGDGEKPEDTRSALMAGIAKRRPPESGGGAQEEGSCKVQAEALPRAAFLSEITKRGAAKDEDAPAAAAAEEAPEPDARGAMMAMLKKRGQGQGQAAFLADITKRRTAAGGGAEADKPPAPSRPAMGGHAFLADIGKRKAGSDGVAEGGSQPLPPTPPPPTGQDQGAMVALRDHALYGKFFRMVEAGEDLAAVQAKVKEEGLEPLVLGRSADDEVEASFGRRYKYRDHPDYEKYFKMLRIGMQVEQVRHKLTQDGKDPGIADRDPDALVEPKYRYKDHPKYFTYFKMVKKGLPMGAVKQRLLMDGLDEAIVEQDPEAWVEEKPAKPVVLVKAREHPQYGTYFRMLAMGLAAEQVRHKMTREGADTSLIDKHKPDDMIPLEDQAGGGGPAASASLPKPVPKAPSKPKERRKKLFWKALPTERIHSDSVWASDLSMGFDIDHQEFEALFVAAASPTGDSAKKPQPKDVTKRQVCIHPAVSFTAAPQHLARCQVTHVHVCVMATDRW